ncbi:hypothetical protein MNBD_GAMMA17-1087 [hydrothermal vent metagenome]|uniref:Cytochrome c domain-containing protein n=1 Tax=hydrothermal vent metagenome TaxID=652676 RepID=A0A3B0ZWW7_9ZZZZ
MKNVFLMTAIAVAGLLTNIAAHADSVTTLQSVYQTQGAGEFSENAGEKMWQQPYLNKKSGKQRSCQTCHGKDLTRSGKHVRTGKVIDPLSPSTNSERLTKVKFIKKWFKRNCKWTIGRECSAQEKGDFLEYLKGL